MDIYKGILVSVILTFSFLVSAQTLSYDYTDGQIYVKYRDDIESELPDNLLASETTVQIPDAWIQEFGIHTAVKAFPKLKYKPLEKAYKIQFTEIQKVFNLIDSFKTLYGVAFAERVPAYYSHLTPNDPSFSPSTTTQWGLYKIKAREAWDISTGDPNILVAVVDDAVKISHQDLSGNLWVNPLEIPGNGIDDDLNGYIDDINGYDVANLAPDPSPPGTASNTNFTHGTHCAGIVAATTNNNIGVASIGFNIKYIAVKCKLNSTSGSSIEAAMEGVQYALTTPARIISMSWGGLGASSVEQLVFDYAYLQGVVLIAAAGNNGNQTPFYPANYDHVLAIGNTTTTDARSTSSNYGNWIDLMAPGTTIYNCLAGSNSSYGNQTGTSMACPLVAGTAGLLLSMNPGLSPDMVYACLKDSADNINAQNTGIIGLIGSGRLNAERALQCAVNGFKPIARFSENTNYVCTGIPVQFTDQSFGSPQTYTWFFQGGTPATSAIPNPSVTWNTPGTYTVRLIVSNTHGADTLEKTAHIFVNGSSQPLPFSEDFENNDLSIQNWFVDNPDSSYTWEITTTGGNPLGGTKSAGINFYNYPVKGKRDGLVTPAFDLSQYSSARLRYSHSHRQYTGLNDSLLIKVSTDCGTSFPHTLIARGGTTLSTNGTFTNQFTPSSAAHWCGTGLMCDTLSLNSFLQDTRVRVRFESVNDNGNNLYIDNIEITGAPKADFTASQTVICAGQSITFQENATGGATNFNWSFTGGNISSSILNQPVVIYNTPGTYQVNLTVSNAYGNHTISRSGYILVSGGITVNVSAPGNLYCDSSAPVLLNTSPTGGLLTGTGISSSSFNPLLAGIGTHRIWYQYTDPYGCGATDSTDIQVVASTPGSISGLSSPVCIDATPLQLTGTPAGGSFQGTGISGSIFNPVLAGQGTHMVQYHYTDISGCLGISAGLVQVNVPVTATLTIPATVCNNDLPQNLFAQPSGGNFSGIGVTGNTFNPNALSPGIYTLSYQYSTNGCMAVSTGTISVLPLPAVSLTAPPGPWCELEPAFPLSFSPPGGSLSGNGILGNSFVPSLAGAGNHALQYSYTSPNGCSQSSFLNLWVTPPPQPLIHQGSFMNICGSGFLSVSGTGPFQWYYQGNPISGANNNIYYPVLSGTYTVEEFLNSCQGMSMPISVLYQPYAIASFTSSLNGLIISFNNTSQNASDYLWDFGDGNTSTQTSPVHTYARPGNYTVTLTANNPLCTDTETEFISVFPSHSHEDLNSVWGIRVYPNPTKDILFLEVPTGKISGNIEIKCIDLQGKTWYQEIKEPEEKQKLELDIPAGLYILEILSVGDRGVLYRDKILKY